MKVNIIDTSPPHQGQAVSTIVEMPQCPAIGEMIFPDESHGGLTVRTVLWTPYSKQYDVQVRGW